MCSATAADDDDVCVVVDDAGAADSGGVPEVHGVYPEGLQELPQAHTECPRPRHNQGLCTL